MRLFFNKQDSIFNNLVTLPSFFSMETGVQLMKNHSRTVDAIPPKVMPSFLVHARERGVFWYDMFYLCATLGLRNSECRELKQHHIDWHTQTLCLIDSKNIRSFITCRAHQQFDAHWLSIG